MRVLILSWDARGTDPGLSPQSAGLASALVAAGHDVRLITRLPEGARPATIAGVEVHAVPDPPPVLPPSIDRPLVAALGFASSAGSVAARCIDQRPVDVVHVEGWQPAAVATSLQTSHDAVVVAALGAGDLTPSSIRHGDDTDLVVQTAAELAKRARLVMVRSVAAAAVVARSTGVEAAVVTPGVDRPARRPGPPPSRGPVVLVAPPGSDHRRFGAALREHLTRPRQITGSWRRRPHAAVVLDPDDVGSALRALASGVPVLAAAGPVGDLVRASSAGWVVDPAHDVLAEHLDGLDRDPGLAASMGAAAVEAVEARHAWDVVASDWTRVVSRALPFRPTPVPDRA